MLKKMKKIENTKSPTFLFFEINFNNPKTKMIKNPYDGKNINRSFIIIPTVNGILETIEKVLIKNKIPNCNTPLSYLVL